MSPGLFTSTSSSSVSGPSPMRSRVGSSTPVNPVGTWTGLKVTMTSFCLLPRALPERRMKGTPAQRLLLMDTSISASVSVLRDGSMPCSSV